MTAAIDVILGALPRDTSVPPAPAPKARVQRATSASAAVAAGAVPLSLQDVPVTGIWRTGVIAAAAWAALGALTIAWPNKEVGFSDWNFTQEFGIAALVAGALLLAIALLGQHAGRVGRLLRPAGQWLIAAPLLLALWEAATAKLGLLPPPFFAPPQSLVDVAVEDWRRLGLSTAHSVRLLAHGFVLGAIVGFATGVWIGWSRVAGYWVHPLLRFLGPVPASALLPLAFFFAPSSYAAAVFLIALATFFPVAVLAWSGVASVNKSYYDVARTLGASEWFLVLRVAVPAALPQVFVGLFMGLGASFSVLVTAEMMGVKAGLGWYLQWAQGWAAYANMYAALLVMAVLCSSLITLLFGVRDRTLSWQKGTVEMVNAIAQPPAAQAAGARIGVHNVSHWYRQNGGVLQVLDDISLDVAPGEFVALLGPSGCGKSTLLRLVAGLEPATAGGITQDGQPITRPDPSRIVVFQDPTLFPWRSVRDNVALGLQARGLLKSRGGRIDDALQLVGLADFADSFPHQLSGGMAQRVALARALVNDPQLLVLDEPLGKLDSLTRLAMQSELVHLWQRAGFSALLVTHDVEEALFLSNRVIVLSDRPARITAELVVDLPYPRHRGHPRLAELRHEALRHLGLDATW